MVEVTLPSAAIDAVLAATAIVVTALAPEPPVEVGVPMMVRDPPLQAAISAVAVIQAMIDNLRMSYIPRSTMGRQLRLIEI
jgi:hypothetical protein